MTRPVLLKSGFRCPGDEKEIQRAARKLLANWALKHTLRTYSTPLGPTTVLTAGEPSDQMPVVLILGGSLAAATIEACVAAIARTREVFVVDVPGEPGMSSPGRPVGHDIRPYGIWLDVLNPQLTSQPTCLVGHGFGAAIAIAAENSNVRRIFLVSPEHVVPSTRANVSTLLRRWQRSINPSDVNRYLDTLTGSEYVPDQEILTWFAKVAVYTVPTPRTHGVPDTVVEKTSARIPVTVVIGTDDRVVSEKIVDRFLDERPHIEKVQLVGIGHLPMLEAPERFARLLESHR
jgi:pimeloyl-ACP methyl ester carboxylesterase